MLFPPQFIFCSGCGKPYRAQFNSGWVVRLAKARVCSKECHDKVEKAYCRGVVGKPDPAGRTPEIEGLALEVWGSEEKARLFLMATAELPDGEVLTKLRSILHGLPA